MADRFKWRHYQGEIILLSVRWYLRYALGYRDLEEMMRERGRSLYHTTIYRWVQAYAPELEKSEIMNIIKRADRRVGKGDIRGQVRFVSSLFSIAA